LNVSENEQAGMKYVPAEYAYHVDTTLCDILQRNPGYKAVCKEIFTGRGL
jgi:hypothetical protein